MPMWFKYLETWYVRNADNEIEEWHISQNSNSQVIVNTTDRFIKKYNIIEGWEEHLKELVYVYMRTEVVKIIRDGKEYPGIKE